MFERKGNLDRIKLITFHFGLPFTLNGRIKIEYKHVLDVDSVDCHV